MSKYLWQKHWNAVTNELTFEKIGRVVKVMPPIRKHDLPLGVRNGNRNASKRKGTRVTA